MLPLRLRSSSWGRERDRAFMATRKQITILFPILDHWGERRLNSSRGYSLDLCRLSLWSSLLHRSLSNFFPVLSLVKLQSSLLSDDRTDGYQSLGRSDVPIDRRPSIRWWPSWLIDWVHGWANVWSRSRQSDRIAVPYGTVDLLHWKQMASLD